MKSLIFTIQMKATEQTFPVALYLIRTLQGDR